MSFRKAPTITGELDYTSRGTRPTKEEGRLAGFLRGGEEVPGKVLGSLLGLLCTVLFSAQVPVHKRQSPPCGQPPGAVDPGARPCLLPDGRQGQLLRAGRSRLREPIQVRQLTPSVSPHGADCCPRRALPAQWCSVPIVHGGHGLIMAAFSPATSVGLAYSRCSVPASQ